MPSLSSFQVKCDVSTKDTGSSNNSESASFMLKLLHDVGHSESTEMLQAEKGANISVFTIKKPAEFEKKELSSFFHGSFLEFIDTISGLKGFKMIQQSSESYTFVLDSSMIPKEHAEKSTETPVQKSPFMSKKRMFDVVNEKSDSSSPAYRLEATSKIVYKDEIKELAADVSVLNQRHEATLKNAVVAYEKYATLARFCDKLKAMLSETEQSQQQ